MMEMKEKSKSGSVAAILQRLAPSVGGWLRRGDLISDLTDIPHSDADRSGHLPKLYSDLISRLRLPLRTSDHPSPLTLLRTDRSVENRATLPPCLTKSHAYFRLSHSACCIFTGANSTGDGCF